MCKYILIYSYFVIWINNFMFYTIKKQCESPGYAVHSRAFKYIWNNLKAHIQATQLRSFDSLEHSGWQHPEVPSCSSCYSGRLDCCLQTLDLVYDWEPSTYIVSREKMQYCHPQKLSTSQLKDLQMGTFVFVLRFLHVLVFCTVVAVDESLWF